jgi:ATP-dependent DNA helicase RecQ
LGAARSRDATLGGNDAGRTLRRYFGHASFRAGQEDLVRAVLDGRDVLAVMPTGSGKSLGFQLPAVRLPELTIVVSPLIALMNVAAIIRPLFVD